MYIIHSSHVRTIIRNATIPLIHSAFIYFWNKAILQSDRTVGGEWVIQTCGFFNFIIFSLQHIKWSPMYHPFDIRFPHNSNNFDHLHGLQNDSHRTILMFFGLLTTATVQHNSTYIIRLTLAVIAVQCITQNAKSAAE